MAFESPAAQAEQLYGNSTAAPGGFASFLLEDITSSPIKYMAVAALSAFVLFFHWATTPKLDSREPPFIKPTIPVIGHVINLLTQQGQFFPNL